MISISASRIPRVVTAGVPTRMPLATIGGFWSNGIAFLLTVIPALPSASQCGEAADDDTDDCMRLQRGQGAAAMA